MSEKFTIAQQFVEAFPQDAARVLEGASAAPASGFIDAVPDSQSVRILSSMLPYHAAKCVSQLSPPAAARYLSVLQPRIIANILRYMTTTERTQILGRLPRRISSQVSIILNYSLSMVGSWLEPTVLVLPDHCSVGDAKARLRNEDYADFHRVYVVDDEEMLVGFVRLARLIRAQDDQPLKDIIERPAYSLQAGTSLDAAIGDPGWQQCDYLPVLDRRRRFLGVLRYAALRAALARSLPADEDQDVSGTFLDLAETCYLSLAEIMNTSLATESSDTQTSER